MENTKIRFATEDDAALIVEFIREIAEYEKMSDEVEVVIIATGFSGGQPAAANDDPASAAQRAFTLSDKIDRTYGEKMAAEAYARAPYGTQSGYGQPYAPAYGTPYGYGQAYAPAGQAPYGQPYGMGYGEMPDPNVAAVESVEEKPQTPTSFEPGDPISETPATEVKEKTKRPRKFLDLFVRQTKKEDK